ncbi:histidinol-phosphatase HisJ family protein [Clostridioides sp. ZZV15-6388]|uniref:histidinol-phosphatase HisJ family protein n=1 Tax=unclassified Clostridioides TaxID=2635829 RepID=UPI001D11BBAB|nr:histidinol-phosphatase HisJ family protein [Clostridioides sp. ZZV15-6388]MCC0666460.1 histidinol-phosphatase HisJ family protein [Clostridioides sp. ZZV15-6597]
MNLIDNHIHTNFSSDGKDSMEDTIKKAISIGVRYLTFTDHLEHDEGKGFCIDYNKYVPVFNKLKEKYKKDIELLLGVEVGYRKHLKNEIKDVINSHPFDFILCSTHTIDNVPVPSKKYFEGLSKEDAYYKYFNSILETNHEFKDYNIYGHLDYISRYGIYSDNRVIYNDFKDVIDEVLKSIINNGSGIELNTSGYRYGLNAIHPNEDILKRYRELGGFIVTVGSDSHRVEDICKDFDVAYDMLKYLDFKYVSLFKERETYFLNIEKVKSNNIA